MPRSPDASLAGRHLFITGGTGFLGRTLLDWVARLNQSGAAAALRVTVMARDPQAFLVRFPRYAQLPWLEFVEGSLACFPTPAGPYTDVIHAAADTHLQGNGAAWIAQIVDGTHAALEFAVRSGAQRFLLTSSGAVYGPQPSEMAALHEHYPGAPSPQASSSLYGNAKRVADQLCSVYHHEGKLQTVVARCFAFSGIHIPFDGPYAIGNFVRDAMSGHSIRVQGDGTAVRSYLSGDEMAHWLLTLLAAGHSGEAYNVGSDHAVTMGDLARRVAAVLSPSSAVVIVSAGTANSARSRYIPAIDKVRQFGLVPAVTLDDIILITASKHADASPSAPI